MTKWRVSFHSGAELENSGWLHGNLPFFLSPLIKLREDPAYKNLDFLYMQEVEWDSKFLKKDLGT